MKVRSNYFVFFLLEEIVIWRLVILTGIFVRGNDFDVRRSIEFRKVSNIFYLLRAHE